MTVAQQTTVAMWVVIVAFAAIAAMPLVYAWLDRERDV